MTFRGQSSDSSRAPSRPSRVHAPALRPPASGFRSQVSGFSSAFRPPSLLPSPFLLSPGRRRSRSAAFTLVELLIGASLSAAVLAAVLSSYIYLGRQLGRLAHQQTLETQARLAIGTFTRDVQTATGLVTVTFPSASPSANRVDLTVPTATGGTQTVIYFYNASLTNSANVIFSTPNGIPIMTLVSMPPASLTRCVNTGSTVTSRTLLRHIGDGNAGTTSDLAFRYYDASGNEYETATLAARSYLPGIRQVALEFATQIVTINAGTSTPVQRESTGRLALRNRPFLQ